MPHYADGAEAKVGDSVTGKLFNTDGVRAGTIVSITPGQEACNAKVAFFDVGENIESPPRMAVRHRGSPAQGSGTPIARVVMTEAHGSSGPERVLFECEDYCDTNKLTKVGP